MKTSGFTFIRNAIRYDYPVAEAILSILPLCDEVVVAVGNSTDGTRELIGSVGSPKIRIIDTVWDETLREGGQVLAAETNKALDAVDPDSDWAFYIQGDEVVHEQSYANIRRAMERWKDNPEVEGLVFYYRHFWGSYDWVGDSRKWYRREVRVIRPGKETRSFKDAQGFRREGRKILVKPADGWIHHYGWVKAPGQQQAKQQEFHRYWHDEGWIRENVSPDAEFDYASISSLKRFEGIHPAVMKERIEAKNWHFVPPQEASPLSFRHLLLDRFETLTGIRIGEYKNYRIV